ncbi:MAG: PAS domain-containing protein [Firmicutes bacterium]|nr:PAS domain-containing protein [Bacillota bacterium]
MSIFKDKEMWLIIIIALVVMLMDYVLNHRHIEYSFLLNYFMLLTLVIAMYKLKIEKNKQRNTKHLTFNIMDNLPVGVIAFDQEGRLIFINSFCQSLLKQSHTDVVGYLAEELCKKLFMNNSACADLVRFVLETGTKVHNQKVSLINGESKEINCRIDVYPMIDQEEYNGAVCILCDITAELNYYDLKRMSDIILRDMSSGVVVVNSKKEIIMFNEAAEEITGLNLEEVISKNYHEILVKRSNRDCILCEAVNENKKICDEEVWYNINGKEICTLNTAEALKDEYNNFLGGISVFQDITDFKNRHQQLVRQEKMATVGQLAAGMAHEIRNPLTAVRGVAQLMLEKYNAKDQGMLNLIIDELDRTEKIIADFLSLANPKEPEYKGIDINQLIENHSTFLNSKCLQNNITVYKRMDPNLPMVWIDEAQITQVLLNLINNAIEAMQEKGKGTITISTSYNINQKDICIEVDDTGKGIPSDNMAKLGTPFFTTKSDGTGLGLAISYEIIKGHAGRIEVSNNPVEGACFKIYLPFYGE